MDTVAARVSSAHADVTYRPEIDGLRALAVLPVIFFHAGFAAFRGGFVGVDIFFVISGYLITTIIVAEQRAGTFSMLRFYERRARRIMPALFVVLAACVPLGWAILIPPDVGRLFESLAAVSTFWSNIYFWHASGYFDPAAELSPLLHTWSLAVEEQYYLFFPLFLIAVRRLSPRVVLTVMGVAFVVSLGVAQWGSTASPSATFYLLPTRGWELLLGACLAWVAADGRPSRSGGPVAEAGGLLGLLCIGLSIVLFDDQTPFPSLYALLPTLGTALVIVCATPATLAGRLLGQRLLVGVGLMSYSAYLWHQPLFAFARHASADEPSMGVFLALTLLTLGLAALSLRYVERPFRRQGRFTRRQIFAGVLIGSTVFLALGLSAAPLMAVHERRWLAAQSPDTRRTALLLKAAGAQADFASADSQHGDGECRFNVERLDDEIVRRIAACADTHGPGVAILGDSHAIGLFGVALAGSREPFIVGVTQVGCRPHSPSVVCQYDGFQAFVARTPRVFRSVVFEQAAFYLLRTARARGSRTLWNRLPMSAPVNGLVPDDEYIERNVAYLEGLARHVPVFWFGPRIEPHISDRFVMARGCGYPYRLRVNQAETFAALEARIAARLRGRSPVTYVSQNAVFGFEFPRDFMTCDAKYWSDGDHLSAAGEVLMGQRFDVTSLGRD